MTVDTADISFGATNLPGFGKEDEVIGTLFSLKAGEMSKPIKGNQAVFVLIPDRITPAPLKDDYATETRMLKNAFTTRSQREINDALKKRAEIKDNRLMFY